jgi:hypothetical protein
VTCGSRFQRSRLLIPRRNLTDAASGFLLSLLSDCLGMGDKERIHSPYSRQEMPRGSRRGKLWG